MWKFQSTGLVHLTIYWQTCRQWYISTQKRCAQDANVEALKSWKNIHWFYVQTQDKTRWTRLQHSHRQHKNWITLMGSSSSPLLRRECSDADHGIRIAKMLGPTNTSTEPQFLNNCFSLIQKIHKGPPMHQHDPWHKPDIDVCKIRKNNQTASMSCCVASAWCCHYLATIDRMSTGVWKESALCELSPTPMKMGQNNQNKPDAQGFSIAIDSTRTESPLWDLPLPLFWGESVQMLTMVSASPKCWGPLIHQLNHNSSTIVSAWFKKFTKDLPCTSTIPDTNPILMSAK